MNYRIDLTFLEIIQNVLVWLTNRRICSTFTSPSASSQWHIILLPK